MYKKILVVNLGGVGDVLLSTPALRALCGSYPQARVSMLVVPRVYEAVRDLPYLKTVFLLEKGLRHIVRTLCTLFSLRRKRYDLVLNMRTLVSDKSAWKMKLFLSIINPRVSAGRDTDGRGSFFDVRIPEPGVAASYEREYDINLVQALSVQVADRSIDFTVSDADAQAVGELLAKEGVSSSDILIGCHPGGEPSRRWPIERYALAIRELSAALPGVFVITGTQAEKSLAQRLARDGGKVIDLTGSLSLQRLGALIKRCRLFISNDTGPMHIAAIVRTPLVAICGPGDLTRFDPRNLSDKIELLWHKVDCAPCNRFSCRDMKCLKMIRPEDVVQAALRVLS